MSHKGEISDLVLQKESVEDKGVVVGKVLSTQIPTTTLMKLVISSSTTSTTTRNTTYWNVQKKGIAINEEAGGSSYALFKPTSNVDPKDEGKSIQIVHTTKEKKRFQSIEMENKGK